MKRGLKIFAIVLVVLIVIVVAIPFFIDANVFRPRLESDLSATLGRQVKVGNLSLSLLSGGVKADDISIADDPAFSNSPFVQAKSLAVGVQLIPLIFSKSLQVTDLTLNQPQISLVRSENGERWNFSSLGMKSSAPAPSGQPTPADPRNTTQPASEPSSSGNPNLTVAKLVVNDGRLTVSRAKSGEKPRVYDKVNMEVKDFSFASSFPFTVTANLPAGGPLKLQGKAGSTNRSDAALAPLQTESSSDHLASRAPGST